MDNLAARYRIIAAEVRAKAGVLSDEQTRQGMLMAAEVWDRLATLAEVSAAASASRPSPGRQKPGSSSELRKRQPAPLTNDVEGQLGVTQPQGTFSLP